MPRAHVEHTRSAVAVQPVICWPAAQLDALHVLAHDVWTPPLTGIEVAWNLPAEQGVHVMLAVVEPTWL